LLIIWILNSMHDEAVALSEYRAGEFARSLRCDQETQTELSTFFGNFLEHFTSALLTVEWRILGNIPVRFFENEDNGEACTLRHSLHEIEYQATE